jgi:leucyl-tRNA synthetase
MLPLPFLAARSTFVSSLGCFSTAGTGAVMCVPAHDTRDHSFALANELPITPIVMPVRF